jgi:hypothetical protein
LRAARARSGSRDGALDVHIEEGWRIASWLQANDFATGKRSTFAHRPNLTGVDSTRTGPEHARALAVLCRTAHEHDVERLAVFRPLVRRHLHLSAD